MSTVLYARPSFSHCDPNRSFGGCSYLSSCGGSLPGALLFARRLFSLWRGRYQSTRSSVSGDARTRPPRVIAAPDTARPAPSNAHLQNAVAMPPREINWLTAGVVTYRCYYRICKIFVNAARYVLAPGYAYSARGIAGDSTTRRHAGRSRRRAVRAAAHAFTYKPAHGSAPATGPQIASRRVAYLIARADVCQSMRGRWTARRRATGTGGAYIFYDRFISNYSKLF